MATIDLDLEALREEIERDRKSLEEKEAVLRFLEKKQYNSITSAQRIDEFSTQSVIQLDELVLNSGKVTLLSQVEDVVSRFGDQEFSVGHVDAALKKNGVEIKGGRFPRSRITTTLGKLEEKKVIKRTYTGGGNTPNRYKLNTDLVK